MSNQLEKLRKENNLQDKQLSKENSDIMTDMVCYLRSSDLSDYDIEIIRKELTGMALEAELREEKFSDVIGDDYKAFCDELMKSGRQKTLYEKVLEMLYIIVYSVGSLYIIEIVFSPTIINIFKSGELSVQITLGFIISTLFIVVFALWIYNYITKKSFELSMPNRKAKILFILIFAVAWAAILLIKVWLGKNVLLSINCLYPIAFLVMAFLVVKVLNNQHANKLFKTNQYN